MPESSRDNNNSKTLVVEADDFAFETVEQHNGQATVIRFQLQNPSISVGDVLVVLSGTDIHFHGLIGKIEDTTATAMDRTGSLLPATVQ